MSESDLFTMSRAGLINMLEGIVRRITKGHSDAGSIVYQRDGDSDEFVVNGFYQDRRMWQGEVYVGDPAQSPGVPTTTDALMQIIDNLWGELPVEIVLRLEAEQPEIVDACKRVHNLVNHG